MIKSVSLRNFMSYSNAEIPLSPGVNFICGPNGSGKSTILIAISLALGLSRTERGRKISDLIRWGAERAKIAIVLDNRARGGLRPFPEFDTDDLRIERLLTRAGSYPIRIDGVPSTKEELTEMIRRQGINPENMLIIMQQDMVEEFSLLSPVDKLSMLEEVMEFQSYRRDLLQAREDLEALLGEEKQTRKILEGSSRRVTEWERLYEKYQRKRNLEDQLDDLTAEALWAKVVEGEKALHQLEMRRGERGQELDNIERRLAELEGRIRERSEQVERAWAELESRKNALLEAARAQGALESRMESFGAQLDEERREVERLSASLDRDRSEVETAHSGDDPSALRKILLKAFDEEGVSRIKAEMASERARLRELERRISEAKEKLSAPFGVDLRKAAEEVATLPGLIGEVYGPLYTCVESDDFSFDVLRSLLGDEMMRSFVTTNDEDQRKVVRFLRGQGIDSTVYVVPESALVLIEERPLPEEKGVLDWAVKRIRGPREVLALLHRVLGQTLLVESGQDVGRMAEELAIPVVKRNGERGSLLHGIVREIRGEVAEARGEIEARVEQLTQMHAKVRERLSQLSEDLDSALAERDQRIAEALGRIISISTDSAMQSVASLSPDTTIQIRDLQRRAAGEALSRFKESLLVEKNRRIRRLEKELTTGEKSGERQRVEISRRELAFQRSRESLERHLRQLYELEGRRVSLNEEMRSVRAAIRDLDYRISRKREDVGKLTERAEELSPRIPSPRDLLELEKEISGVRGSLTELAEVPDDIEGVYRMYLKEFENLKTSLESIIERKEDMQRELRRGLDRWREIMDGFLKGVNEDFNDILAEIGGRGRVELVGKDIRKVGLDIKVGLGGKEVVSISTLSQSGGEKSLSTMAFLLALQRQIKSPFRAVDEYDVHLDPVNRDRVTKLLRSAVRADSKQYVAITPSQIAKEDLEGADNVIVVQTIEGRSRVGSLVLEA